MMKMKPVKAIIETCMTILGPYLSAAHPLNCCNERKLVQTTLFTHQQTDNTTRRTSVTQGRLPVGRDGVTDFGLIGSNAEPFQEVG